MKRCLIPNARGEDYHGREYEALRCGGVTFREESTTVFLWAKVLAIRYEGMEVKVGPKMNVIKDVIITGPLLQLTNDVLSFVQTQIKEHTYLGENGRIKTDVQYPEFC